MTTVIAVISLGYVGLPLVVEFGKHSRTIGFDIAVAKVESCQRGVDPSRQRRQLSGCASSQISRRLFSVRRVAATSVTRKNLSIGIGRQKQVAR
jgi:UDP-N-acetyl-D-mannosaminuronate dehydrogenase